MCTNCSSEPASPAHILECSRAHQAGLSRRYLAGVGFFESGRCYGSGLALLTNGGVQQQHFNVSKDLPQTEKHCKGSMRQKRLGTSDLN
ncbi:hypothetical protein TNCV_246021 [Trichonephila clavipes]|nr:hypothetical protein TNCV_246021 [Trichonephila clavipes]